MKRYDIELPDDVPYREWPWPLREDPDGDWVEFEEAWKEIQATQAVVNNAVEKLADTLSLTIPEHRDPVRALVLDIRRLLEVEARWSEACEIARLHCPVGDGESHVRQGIPRMAERARVAEEEVERLRRLMPPGGGRSEGGVGEGSWAVFAGKVAEERDSWQEAAMGVVKAFQERGVEPLDLGSMVRELFSQRDRARALIKKALWEGKTHASEYAWEALVEGADAALADEPQAEGHE